VVFPQLARPSGIDHPALRDDVHEVDQLERQRGVLLDQLASSLAQVSGDWIDEV